MEKSNFSSARETRRPTVRRVCPVSQPPQYGPAARDSNGQSASDRLHRRKCKPLPRDTRRPRAYLGPAHHLPEYRRRGRIIQESPIMRQTSRGRSACVMRCERGENAVPGAPVRKRGYGFVRIRPCRVVARRPTPPVNRTLALVAHRTSHGRSCRQSAALLPGPAGAIARR